MSLMTEVQQQDVRERLVATATLALEEIPLDLRYAALEGMIVAFAKEIIAKYDGVTVADFSAILVKDRGLGTIAEEILVSLARLEAGAGAVEREALAALAKGTGQVDPDKGA